jgi:ABC-type transporter Mla subunit MlaD
VSTPRSNARADRRGLLILAGLVVAAVAVFNLDGIADLGRRDLAIVALVHDAPGVRVGTDVWVEGVKVGRVRKVSIQNRDETILVALDLRIDAGATSVVTAASDVRASRRRFIAEPVVRIFAGDPGDPPLQDGDTIRGHARRLPADLAAEAATLRPAFDSILAAARLIEGRVQARRPRMEALDRQRQEIRDATSTLARDWETGSLARMLDDRAGLAPRLRALHGHLEGLDAAIADLAGRFGSGTENELAARLDDLGRRTSRAQEAVRVLEARIQDGEGFLGRVQADSALAVAVRGVQLQMDSLRAEAHAIAFRMLLP